MAAHSKRWSLRLTTGETVDELAGTSDEVWDRFGEVTRARAVDVAEIFGPSGNLLARWRRDRQLRQSTLFGAALFGAAVLVGSFDVQSVSASVNTENSGSVIFGISTPAAGGEKSNALEISPAVRPVQSPCKALRGQHTAALREVKAKVGTRAVLTDVEAASTIARALFAECGWSE